jgi:pre-rRNA-processing protein TSR3
MSVFPPTIILRHRKENLKKCSLQGLESRADCKFFTYPTDCLPDLSSYILLKLDAPCLSLEDADYGLFLIDATWRHSQTIFKSLAQPHRFMYRSLPSHFQTAYPRRQEDCPDPQRGLASIEALFLAYHLLGRDTSGLLDFYYWKDIFMKKNQEHILKYLTTKAILTF